MPSTTQECFKTEFQDYFDSAMAMLERGACGIEVHEHLGWATELRNDLNIIDCIANAEKNDTSLIKTMVDEAVSLYGKDIVYMTELSFALNEKSWEHYRAGHKNASEYYAREYHRIDDYIFKTFGSDGDSEKNTPEISYYISFSD